MVVGGVLLLEDLDHGVLSAGSGSRHTGKRLRGRRSDPGLDHRKHTACPEQGKDSKAVLHGWADKVVNPKSGNWCPTTSQALGAVAV